MSSLRLALKQSMLESSGTTSGDHHENNHENDNDDDDDDDDHTTTSSRNGPPLAISSRKRTMKSTSTSSSSNQGGMKRPRGRPPKRRKPSPPQLPAAATAAAAEGDPPRRKRGRPRKNPLPQQQQEQEKATAANNNNNDDDDDKSSSEAEFSVGHEDDYEESSDEEEEEVEHSDDNEEEEEEERSKLQKKAMKRAANMIQSHWKRNKKRKPVVPQSKEEEDDEEEKPPQPLLPSFTTKKSSGQKAKTVPPPDPELVLWVRSLSIKKQKRNVTKGMRVKVRFATNVRKRNGTVTRKLKWYGGVVTGVSIGGGKIRIKYDDGTSEVSKFPDTDIIVDNQGNGQHHVNPGMFVPPPPPSSPQQPQRVVTAATASHTTLHDDHHHGEDETNDKWEEKVAATSKKRTNDDDDDNHEKEEEDYDDGEESNRAMQQKSRQSDKKPKALVMEERSSTALDDSSATNEHPKDEAVAKHGKTFSDSSQNEDRDVTTRHKNATDDDENDDKDDEEEKMPEQESSERDSASIVSSTVQVIGSHNEHSRKPSLKIRLKPMTQVKSSSVKESTETESHQHHPSSSDDDEVQAETNRDKNQDSMLVDAILETMDKQPVDDSPKNNEDEDRGASKSQLPISSERNDAELDPQRASAQLKRAHDDTYHQTSSVDDEATDAPQPKKKKKRVEETLSDPTLRHRVEEQDKVVTTGSNDNAEPKSALAKSNMCTTQQEAKDESTGEANDQGTKQRAYESDGKPPPKSPSPPPKSPTPMAMDQSERMADDLSKPLSSPAKKDDSDKEEKDEETDVGSSKSAFDQKDKAALDGRKRKQETEMAATRTNEAAELRKLATTPPPLDADAAPLSIPRFGRRAAQQANQRISERKERVIEDPYAKKKKRKDKDELKLLAAAERKRKTRGSDSDDEDEPEWVQCDSCHKWRVLPNDLLSSDLPKLWYCEMNTDPYRNTCDAPEQTPQEIAKERRRKKRKLAKIARLEAAGKLDAETAAAQREALNEEKKPRKQRPSARSPVPTREAEEGFEADSEAKRSSPIAGEESTQAAESPGSGSDTQMRLKAIKQQSSFGSSGRRSRTEESEDAINMEVDICAEAATTKVKTGRGRGRRRSSDRDIADKGKAGKEGDPDNLEWVQCEKCNKWRRLPSHISADSLPDVWYCSMNSWDPRSASCEAAEDKADPAHREFGIYGSGVSTASYGNKLSYRNLIFGNGRKQKGPMSERTRAAESLFLTPTDPTSDGITYPTVMYAKSSVFLPRTGPGAPRRTNAIIEDGDRVSLFEIMSKSQLWAELRGASVLKPDKIGSYNGNAPFDALSDDMKGSMKQLILHALGSGTLSCHEVLLESQCRQWFRVPPEWAEIRASCTIDIVEGALRGLVSDGLVESVNGSNPDMTLIKYRRVAPPNTTPTPSKETRTTRCMKIAKPWKKSRASMMEFRVRERD